MLFEDTTPPPADAAGVRRRPEVDTLEGEAKEVAGVRLAGDA